MGITRDHTENADCAAVRATFCLFASSFERPAAVLRDELDAALALSCLRMVAHHSRRHFARRGLVYEVESAPKALGYHFDAT